MSKVNAEILFQNDFNGILLNKNKDVLIGYNGLAPYDMLQGALVACFHATFLEIVTKKRIVVETTRYLVEGIKREEIPTMLNEVKMDIFIKTDAKKEPILKSFELAAKYCSVYNTIAQVATITYDVNFE